MNRSLFIFCLILLPSNTTPKRSSKPKIPSALQTIDDEAQGAVEEDARAAYVQAIQEIQEGNFQVGLNLFIELSNHFKIVEIYLNIGVAYERLLQRKAALDVYEYALKLFEEDEPHHKLIEHLCHLCANDFQMGKMIVDSNTKSIDYCRRLQEFEPNSFESAQQYGAALVLTSQWGAAIDVLQRALELMPDEPRTLHNLAQAQLRSGDYVSAIHTGQKAVDVRETPESILNLATAMAVSRPGSEGVMKLHERTFKLIERAHKVSKKKCGTKFMKIRLDWEKVKSPSVHFQTIHTNVDEIYGRDGPQIFRETKYFNPPYLKFQERKVYFVTLEDIYVEGTSGIMYNDCEIFAGGHGYNLKLKEDFTGEALTTETVNVPVASVIQQTQGNYYHWTVETVTRLLWLREQLELAGVTTFKWLLPRSSLADNTIKLLGIKERNVMWYEAMPEKRYKFKKLYFVDWIQTSKDERMHDAWTTYFPPKAGTLLTKSVFQEAVSRVTLLPDDVPDDLDFSVVYLSRKSAWCRNVINEKNLIKDLRSLINPSEFYVFNCDKTDGDSCSIESQTLIFSKAKIVIGPHGASWTNMIYMEPGSSVIRFPMKPDVDRCFGHLAMSLDLDYWVVPEVTSYYYQNYELGTLERNIIVATVDHVIRERHMEHVLNDAGNCVSEKWKSEL